MRRAAFYLATLLLMVNVCVTYYSWEFVRYTQLYSDDIVEYLQEQAQRVAVPPYYDLYILPSAPLPVPAGVSP